MCTLLFLTLSTQMNSSFSTVPAEACVAVCQSVTREGSHHPSLHVSATAYLPLLISTELIVQSHYFWVRYQKLPEKIPRISPALHLFPHQRSHVHCMPPSIVSACIELPGERGGKERDARLISVRQTCSGSEMTGACSLLTVAVYRELYSLARPMRIVGTPMGMRKTPS